MVKLPGYTVSILLDSAPTRLNLYSQLIDSLNFRAWATDRDGGTLEDLHSTLGSFFGKDYFLGMLHDSSEVSHSKIASALTTSLDLNDLGENWIPVSELEVLPTLRDLLFKSLAYASSRTMPEEDAIALANRLLALVPGSISCYVNFHKRGESIRTSSSLTEATFDAGMVIIGKKDQLLFCRSEED